ncbi:Rhamnogalacturonides degradation protein RhiN [Arcticibacter svalbardensis MN12-7]|uniref:Rhamnogalacturonides degradation protein RhiN n=1 Tax=Arcticibacter svalbardensis MN12-7 TaxID=1150600 RepID=R9H0L2_9SPHI|nr:glycoside hydrolase family 88 protein [Arcticibacter svalbardensis]EOR94754.1 Rhamnogalacturonides degradation protein RhiN [Arcticibacter svalbardensis MN12-7]
MKRITTILTLSLFFCFQVLITKAQTIPLSERMTNTVMDIWSDSLWVGRPFKWTYDQGVLLEGVSSVWQRTGDKKYFDYIKKSMDFFVQENGDIRTYDKNSHNIDNIKNGRALLLLYNVTGQVKYFKAAQLLRHQLSEQPRTKEGGFWHKRIYPNQMWLDGLYMGQPFYAEFSAVTNDTKAFDDITNQFVFMERHSRDAKTGLMIHGWDESKEQQWANKTTGQSPHVWGRAMGWYGMALVDALEYFPDTHPGKKQLIDILNRYSAAVTKSQQPSGLWYDIIDVPKGKGNYFESSAASMFVYALAKGVRQGYLPQSYFKVAQKGYEGMKKEFVEEVNAEKINFKGTVTVSGLGGKPYRDGSYGYYMSEKAITNDPKGVGAFISASNEMELATMPKPGIGKTVTLDYYFNNEYKKGPLGQDVRFHYTWEDQANSGFWFWRNLFNYAGAKTNHLEVAPTALNLKNTSVYIIVDPDTEKESPKPNFVQAKDATELVNWVEGGGVLVLMTNDVGNAEFTHFNTLAQKFGITFNEDQKNPVTGSQFEMAAIPVPAGNAIFKTAKKLYIKELSTIQIKAPAKPFFTHKGDIIMATAKLGKGTVFAIGDPWFYNEYVDGRRLSADFDNFKAANDLANWLLQQASKR